jgi:hypothetical protein
MLFRRRPGIAASPPHIIRTKTINTISTSTANSMNFYLPRLPHLLRPVPGPDTVSAYQVADEPGQQLVPVLDLREEPIQDPMPTTGAGAALRMGDSRRVDMLTGSAPMVEVAALANFSAA